jgi:hypothetical protein
MLPHVVCVTPTYQRPEMLRVALHAFLAQDYAGPATMYILDDGPEPWRPCCGQLGSRRRVVYRWEPATPHRNCATKRNLIMAEALRDEPASGGGPLFALWDDDDLHGPARLRHQVEALVANPDAELCILDGWLLYDVRRHVAAYAKGLPTDGTSAFTLAHWERAGWDETTPTCGPARLTYQMARAPETIVRVTAPDDYVVVRHGANHTGEPGWAYRGGPWRPCPVSADELASRLRTGAACRSPRS